MDLRKLSTDTAPLYINSKCGEVPHLQISWCPHLCQPLLDTAAHSSHQKGSGALTLPESPQDSQQLQAAVDLLLLLHGEPASQPAVSDRMRLQRAIEAAQRIIGCPLPSMMDIYTSRCFSTAEAITKEQNKP